MYRLTITISKTDVISEVNKTCGYMGARIVSQDGSGNLYNNISTSKEDAEMMERFWREGCAGVVATAKEFVVESTLDDTALVVAYDLPEKYNKAMDVSVNGTVLSSIVTYILSKWFVVCGMDALAQLQGQAAVLTLKQLEILLYARTFDRVKDEPSGDNSIGDDVESIAEDTDDDEPSGDNSIGDDVESIAEDTDDDEPSGDNSIGDDVESIAEDTDDDEPSGDNSIGDDVESIAEDADDDEPSGDNSIGGIFPQGFGPVKVERYTYY